MPQPQQQQSDNSLDFLWMIVLVVGIILVGWYFGKKYIAIAIFHVKLVEIALIQFVISLWAKFAAFLHLPTPDLTKLNNWVHLIHIHAAQADFATLAKVSSDVGVYLRYPIIVILLVLAFILYKSSVALRFKATFTMKRLRDTEKVNWPRIMPVVGLDLVEQDIKKGPWAMSLNPIEFCRQNKLIEEQQEEDKVTAKLITGAAYNVLALQLGPMWSNNFEALPMHMQALLAIFVARADGNATAADKLLDQIALSSASGHYNFSGARELLAKHINAKPIIKTIGQHAYVYTVMAAMLDLARSAGVLAAADFLWLKPLDRKLWYVLNSVGRQTAVAEVAGIFSHWLAENRLGRAVKVPMVEEAVRGLEDALQEVIYVPDEDED